MNFELFLHSKANVGASLVVQWLGLHTHGAGDLGLIPDQGTRSHMSQKQKKKIKYDKFTTNIKQVSVSRNLLFKG